MARVRTFNTSDWKTKKAVVVQLPSYWRLGIVHVTCQPTFAWKTLNKVTKKATIDWNLVGRSKAVFTFNYNVLNPVVVQDIIKWNVGMPVVSRIRQTSADRTDFIY